MFLYKNLVYYQLCILPARGMPYSSVITVTRCMSVYVCHSRYCTETAGRVELIIWHGGFLPLILHCAVRKFIRLQTKGTFLRNFVPNSVLRPWHVSTPCQLSSTNVDAQCDKLATVVGRTKLTIIYSTIGIWVNVHCIAGTVGVATVQRI